MAISAITESSVIRLQRPLWRQLLLFQSFNQFVSYALWCGVILLAADAFAWLIRSECPSCVLTGTFIGTIPALIMALQAQWTFSFKGRPGEIIQAFDLIFSKARREEKIEAEGYSIRYRSTLPRALRWDEMDYFIYIEGSVGIAKGQWYMLWYVKRKLRKLIEWEV